MPKKPTIKDLQQQIGELTESLQRERADATNIRRRHEEQLANLKDMVKSNIVAELLPAIDNLDRALSHTPKELAGSDYVKGVNSVVKQFEKTLADIGVEKIKTVGEVFDPNLHEAAVVEDADAGGDKEIISEELQSGYRLGDEIIRHAMVKVTRK